jgi:lipoate-protein ligase A
VQSLGVPCEISGTSDLTLGGHKVSGNSMRCKRNYFIYHGTLLYEMSIEKISKCLGTPVRQPDYRDSRSHQEFLTLIPRSGDQLREALIGEWSAHENLRKWPKATTRRLVELKYDTQAWVHSR